MFANGVRSKYGFVVPANTLDAAHTRLLKIPSSVEE